MNPNATAGIAPQRLMQDVAPPYARATAQPAPTASPPQQTMSAPSSSAPNEPAPVEPGVAAVAEVQSPPLAQPMFPVAAETRSAPVQVPVQSPASAPSAQTQAPVSQVTPTHTDMPNAPAKSKTNWLIIFLAIIVAAGLAYAAYLAFKGSS